jgi:hypothetical protein
LAGGLKRYTLDFILVINFGWSKLSIWGDQLWNPINTKHWLILSFFFFSHGSIHCILQLSCLQTWILFTQEYAMAFWMKTITKSTRFCLSIYNVYKCNIYRHPKFKLWSLLLSRMMKPWIWKGGWQYWQCHNTISRSCEVVNIEQIGFFFRVLKAKMHPKKFPCYKRSIKFKKIYGWKSQVSTIYGQTKLSTFGDCFHSKCHNIFLCE